LHWAAWRNDRLNIDVAKQALKSCVASRLVRQWIGFGETVVTKRAALRTVNRNAEIVRVRLLARRSIRRCQLRLHCHVLGGAEDKKCRDVVWKSFKFDIRNREAADVAACARERNPGSRSGLAEFVDHLRLTVTAERCPIQERTSKTDGPIGAEKAIAVGDRHAHAVAIDAGLRRENVGGGVRDQRCVMIAADGAVIENKIQKVRHLFKI